MYLEFYSNLLSHSKATENEKKKMSFEMFLFAYIISLCDDEYKKVNKLYGYS